MRAGAEGTTPSLGETIRTVVDSVLTEVNTCLPGKVVAYSATTQYADVEIQLSRKLENGSVFNYPVVAEVPVKHPRAQGGRTFIHMPVTAGDDVVLVISQRSLDNWKHQGGMSDPADRRRFHISDAYALIGGSALPDAFTVNDPTAIEVVNQAGKLQILASGQINLGDFAPSHAVGLADVLTARISALEAKVNTHIAAYVIHNHPANIPPVVSPPVPLDTPLVPDPTPTGSSKVRVVT